MPLFENGVWTINVGQIFVLAKRISIPHGHYGTGGYLNPGTIIMCARGGTVRDKEEAWSLPHLSFDIIEPKCDLETRERAARGLTVQWNWNIAFMGFLDTIGLANPMLKFAEAHTR